MIKALTTVALVDGEIVGKVKKIDFKYYKFASESFARFNDFRIINEGLLELII